MKFLKLKTRDTDGYILVNMDQIRTIYIPDNNPDVCGITFGDRDTVIVKATAEKLEKALGFHADIIEI